MHLKEEALRLTGFRFNVFLGLISLIGFPLISPDIPLKDPPWWVAPIGMLFYLGEMWAFNYKVRLSRARILRKLTGGNPAKTGVNVMNAGCLIFYGFLIRFCLRFALLMLIGDALGIVMPTDDPPWWLILLMIVACLFELCVFGFSMFWTRAINTESTREDDEKAIHEEEVSWRKKYFKWLDDPYYPIKELASDAILFIFAVLLTKAFWDPSNASFVDYIRRAYEEGESPLYVWISILVANFLICLFFLVPVRLAYWVEESMTVFTARDRWRYVGSLFFAGVMITLPCWVELWRLYV